MIPASIAFLFPGQGAQYPGIGKDLFDNYRIVRDTYEQASDTLGYDIAELSFKDPDNQINLTRFTQPVLLTHSIACYRVFADATNGSVRPVITAGHSLGEYSALVCADALSFPLALALVKTRGELMGQFGEGEMAALMVDPECAEELAEQHYCAISACNLPHQTVVGGGAQDLDKLLAAMAEKFPAKRSVRLKTEGAFHTYYMVEAARRFRAVLEPADFSQPRVDVLSNFTGGIHDADTSAIKSRLFLQLFNPVLWRANLLTAGDAGVNLMIEFGGGLGKGENPAEKRPNLESIVKKTFRGRATAPAYLSVINLATLSQTVEFVQRYY